VYHAMIGTLAMWWPETFPVARGSDL
jgi:hypothetical protein